MKRYVLAVLCSGALLAATAPLVWPCAVEYTLRLYRKPDIWRPLAKYEDALGTRLEARARPDPGPAFAGMDSRTDDALGSVRAAYRAKQYQKARQGLDEVPLDGLPQGPRREAALLDAKLDLRLAEADPESIPPFPYREPTGRTSEQEALLESARLKLTAFLEEPAMDGFRDEAAGWLARIHALQGRTSQAAKYYLDELAKPDSMYPRQSLINSLRSLYPYNGSSNRLPEQVGEFLDTPAHALFAVSILTNPRFVFGGGPPVGPEVIRTLIPALIERRELFVGGEDSTALALALMRAALYLGDIQAALDFSRLVPAGAPAEENLEYNWMVAVCRALGGARGEAEGALERILASARASRAQRLSAAMGLMNVMEGQNRRAELLRAAFLFDACQGRELYASGEEGDEPGVLDGTGRRQPWPDVPWGFDFRWPFEGWLVDLPYLLDVHLDDADLEACLTLLDGGGPSLGATPEEIRRFAREIRYALAVRLARQERFDEAALRYEQAGADGRAERMRRLAELYAKTVDGKHKGRSLLLARFAYADFLSRHADRVFFNDTLWYGYQGYALMTPNGPGECSDGENLGKVEAKEVCHRERAFRDAQEERWRAALIFTDIAAKGGRNWLGRTAALRAMDCLGWINERFGRYDEIKRREDALKAWRAGRARSPV